MMKRIYLFLLLFSLNTLAWSQATDLIISEYVEGSSNNKYVELYNGTGASVDLSNYRMQRIVNGGSGSTTNYSLSGTLADGSTYVIANTSANTTITNAADITSGLASYNGDDVITLQKSDGGGGFNTIDVIGEDTGSDPGSGWDVAGTSNATANHTLVRKSTICSPNSNWDNSRGTNTTDSEWTVTAQDDFSNIGTHTAVCASTTIVSFASLSATVAEDAGAVTMTVCLNIVNEDASTATTADVVLTGGTATNGTDITTYNTTGVTFPANSNTQQCVTITITEDSDFEGDETLIFEVQNVAGGNSAAASGTTTMTVTITDNDIPAIYITEIMYNTASTDDEWIEIYNGTGGDIDVSNWTIEDGGSTIFTFPGSTTLTNGSYSVIAVGSNGDGSYNNEAPFEPDFNSITANNSDVRTTGNTNELSNSAGTITLKTSSGSTIDEVAYDDGDASATDGNGSSFELIDFSLDNSSTSSNWQASPKDGGTPKAANGATTWRGTTDMTWATASNWSEGGVPSDSVNAFIDDAASNNPTLSGTMNMYNLNIENGRSITLTSGGILNVINNFTVETGGTFTQSDGTFNLSQDISNAGTLTISGGTLVFNGTTAAQTMVNGTYNNVTINNTGGADVDLSGAVTINGTLTLTSGLIDLSTNNLTIASGGSISGGSSSSYIKTNSTGTVKAEVSGSNVTFPVGNSSYNPVVLSNSGTTDNFSIRVVDQQTTDGTDGGTATTSDNVGRMWMIAEDVAGSSNVTMTLQWNASEELTGFTRTSCIVGHYTGSTWTEASAATAATGSDPYTRTASGITSFSPFAIGNSTASLPVEFVDFKAEIVDNQTQLTWQTATEENNAYFAIERSSDGENFEEIGTVEGNGTTFTPQSYNFTDAFPANGVNYYRLKQVDFNGVFEYSNIKVVEFGTSVNDIKVFPNPTKGQLNIVLPTTNNTQIEVIDWTGRVVKSFNTTGNTIENISIKELPNGQYILRLIDGQEVITTTFIKAN